MFRVSSRDLDFMNTCTSRAFNEDNISSTVFDYVINGWMQINSYKSRNWSKKPKFGLRQDVFQDDQKFTLGNIFKTVTLDNF